MKKILSAAVMASLLLVTCFCDAQAGEKTRKGKPADAEILNITPQYVNDFDMNMDSGIEDWNAIRNLESIQFQTLISGEYDYDWTGPKDLSATVKMAYSTTRLYFLIQVKDNVVTQKTRKQGSDQVEIWLKPQNAKLGGLVGLSIDLGPLKDGEPPALKWIQPASRKKIFVETAAISLYDGYDIELAIPYSELANITPIMGETINYCVLVRDWDQDDPNEDEAAIASCKISPKNAKSVKPAEMGKFTLDISDELWKSVVKSNNHIDGNAEFVRAKGDVSGDSLPDLIAARKQSLVVAGIGLTDTSGGKPSWTQFDMGYSPDTEVKKIETRDVNADGKEEILLYTTERCTGGAYEADNLYIIQWDGHIVAPELAMQLEVRDVNNPENKVTNNISFKKGAIEQSVAPGSAKAAPIEICSHNSGHAVQKLIQPGGKKLTHQLSNYGFSIGAPAKKGKK